LRSAHSAVTIGHEKKSAKKIDPKTRPIDRAKVAAATNHENRPQYQNLERSARQVIGVGRFVIHNPYD